MRGEARALSGQAGSAAGGEAQRRGSPETGPEDKDVLYSKAVVHCLLGETEPAITTLRLALEHGYSQFDMKKDDDLAILRPLPTYRKYCAKRHRSLGRCL